MSIAVSALLLTVVTALACALPGVFIVLRKESMLVDAMGHAVFPGIVVGYAFTRDLDSPILIVGAAIAGLAVVWGAEMLYNTGLITRDASQGLLFPALFAAGVIMVSGWFTNVHLDEHVVLVGDVNLASFDHVILGSYDFGPKYMYVMLAVLALNVLFLALTLRQMTLNTFDPNFARVIGIPTRLLSALFMFVVALTVTAAFNAAGALLVLALVVAPAATASLMVKRISAMIAVTLLIATGGALAGFSVAYVLDLATSAMLSVFYALIFVVVLLWRQAVDKSASR